MSDNTTISFVRDNMEQGEFLSFVGGGLLKALGSVIVIISAFIATSYLFSLQNDLVNLNLIICIVVFISVYIRVAEISAFKEFFITDKFNFDSNLLSLVTAQLVSWITTVGFNIALYILILLWSAWDDPLSQAIFKILCLSIIASSFFIYTKRDEVWTKEGFDFWRAAHYLIMGTTFGIGTYALGGIIVISSELLGWALTIIGIGLEIILASVYTYMDLQEWVKNYKWRQITDDQREILEQEYKDAKDIASRLGKY
jgi:hypothetical protein